MHLRRIRFVRDGSVEELLPRCYPGRKRSPPEMIQAIDFIGAGEGIRTLDPNLGKVVLYP
jgi:hypothetical protein